MRRSLIALVVALAAGWGGLLYWGRVPPAPPASGMARQTEIRLAAQLSGRLATVAVQPGQHVARGAPVATLEVPELAAALGEARAAAASVEAERARIFSGSRPEEIAVADEAVRTSEANLTLARQVDDRIRALTSNDFASRAQLDESEATLGKAVADLALKQAQLRAAQAGPTVEERALADAQVALARARVAELEARLAKARIEAPADGVIGIQVAEAGEILAPGKPVATLIPDNGGWLGFTLREDRLGPLALGAEVAVADSAGQPISARLVELRPLGEFATWRAARAVGDHDLNSFRLRLDPLTPEQAPEAGRSVWLQAQAP